MRVFTGCRFNTGQLILGKHDSYGNVHGAVVDAFVSRRTLLAQISKRPVATNLATDVVSLAAHAPKQFGEYCSAVCVIIG